MAARRGRAEEALALASSTASTISPLAYEAAEATRAALVDAASSGRLDLCSVALEFKQLKRRLLLACGFDPAAGVAVVLTPSGTDGEFAALHLARGTGDAPLVNILIAPDETGSGVPYSAQGRHFSPRTPQGTEVACGAALAGMHELAISLNTVEIRDRCGLPRPIAEIDAKVEQLAADALRSGAHCLVHLLDSSKTGLRAPSFDLARKLRACHGNRINVVVDACQMRLGKAQLRAYLAAGFMVQITGSKFYMGPPFPAPCWCRGRSPLALQPWRRCPQASEPISAGWSGRPHGAGSPPACRRTPISVSCSAGRPRWRRWRPSTAFPTACASKS